MAIAFVRQAENTGDTASNSIAATWGGNTATGNLSVLGVAWTGSGINVSSVTDSQGNTYQSARAKTAASSGIDYYQIWYAENITGGTTPTVTVNFSGSATFRRIGMHEVSGLATSGSLDQTNAGTATSGTTVNPGNVTTTVADEYLFAGGTCFNNETFTQGTNWNARTTPATDTFTQDRIVSSTGTYATSFTDSLSAEWVAQAATFKAPDAAPSSGVGHISQQASYGFAS